MHLARVSPRQLKQKKPKDYIKTSVLVLIAFSSTFFSRVFDTLGAPATVNFLHFVTVPFACTVALTKTRTKDRHQIFIAWAMIYGLLLLLAVMLASALLNDAAFINVVLEFMLLGEPFLFLLAIVSTPMSPDSFNQLRNWICSFCLFHLALVFVQKYVLRLDRSRALAGADLLQGVFYFSGAGHVVGASISLTFGLYYLISAKKVPLVLRSAIFLATCWQVIIADAKQVILVFFVAGLLLLLTKFKDIVEAIKYLLCLVIAVYTLLWCMANVPAFDAFNTWANVDLYGPEGDATLLKTASFRIITSYYESPLNWVLGLGPGHTVGRLGGWMLKIYRDLLAPFGPTIHPASGDSWRAVGASWLGSKSSMFSPLFGWAGIWGDLGFLGLAAYLFLATIVWHYICLDDFSRFLLLTVFVFGLIFTQMEEPSYMLFISTILGVRWQQHQNKASRSR